MGGGTQWTNLVDTFEFVNGAEILRGACSQNARDPNAPEFGKWKKIENHSWLGWGSNIDTVKFQNFDSKTRVEKKRLTRGDF